MNWYGGDEMKEAIIPLSNVILSIWTSRSEDEILGNMEKSFEKFLSANKVIILLRKPQEYQFSLCLARRSNLKYLDERTYKIKDSSSLSNDHGTLTCPQLLRLSPELKTILDVLQTDFSLYYKYCSWISLVFFDFPHFRLSECAREIIDVVMFHSLAAMDKLQKKDMHTYPKYLELISQLKPVTDFREEPHEIISRLLQIVERMFNAEAGIMLFDNEHEELVLQSPAFKALETDISLYRLRLSDEGNASRVFITGKGYYSNRAQGDPNIIQRYVSMYNVNNLATVPIQGEFSRIGVLHVINRKDNEWVSEDLYILQLIASQIGYIMENARLLKQISIQKIQAEETARTLEKQKNIIEQQRMELEQSLSLHHLFTDILISGQGLEGIVKALAEKIKGPVILLDEYKKNVVVEWIQDDINRNENGYLDNIENYHTIPIEYMEQNFGFIVLGIKEPDEWGKIAIEQAKLMICLELMHQKAISRSERQKKSDILAKLIQKDIDDKEVLLKEGLEFGHNLESDHFLVAVEVNDNNNENYYEFIQSILGRMQIKFLGLMQLNYLILMISKEHLHEKSIHTISQFVDHFQREIRKYKTTIDMHLGISRPYHQLPDYYEGYKEALKALTLARCLGKFYVYIEENKTLEILLNIDSASAHHYIMKVIGPLIVNDRTKGGVLISTLKEYLNSNGNLTQTAEACYAHVNTIRYRLTKIQQLLDCDLKDHATMFELQLALNLYLLQQTDKKSEYPSALQH
jgi:sugar diacid utilization regulator